MSATRGVSVALMLVLAALSSSAGPACGAPAGGAPADLDAILEKAQAAQKADMLAWAKYRFRRKAVKEILDDADVVLETEDLEFLVTPGFEQFDETLLRINGKDPTPGEVKRHRRQGLFNRHYDMLLSGAEGEDAPDGYTLALLLHLAGYRYGGKESVEGVDCHRVDFFPQPQPGHTGLAGKITAAMAGSLWITAAGFHLARAEAATVRPVPLVFSLAKVHSLKVRLESRPVGEDVWLPRNLEVLTDARILVKTIHKRNIARYSHFERVEPRTEAR